MPTKFSSLTQVLPTERGPVMEVFVGEAYDAPYEMLDATDTPISLSGQTITIQGDWYLASIAGTTATFAEKIPNAPVATLTFTPNSNQTANPGKGIIRIPADLYDTSQSWADEIEINQDQRPLLVCYHTRNISSGTEIRKSTFGITFRRGAPTPGPSE